MRIIQTVLREPDIKNYDAEAVIDYVESLEGNTIVVNGGGIVAFYDSLVDPHYKNRFGNGEDVLRQLVPVAHARGIRVIVRVDFRGAKRYIYNRYPEWFGLNADGSPKMVAGIHAACINSPYRWEHAFKILREILIDCEVDGIWENAASFHGTCYCSTCRAKFKKEHGLEIPRLEDWNDPAWAVYHEWRHRCKAEQTKAWRDVIKSCGDDKAYCSEFPGPNLPAWAYHGALDISRQAGFLDFLVGCCFVIGRDSYGSPFRQTPIWGSMELVKYLRNVDNEKPPVVLFSHLEQTSRYTSEPPRDLAVWLEGILATGGSWWDCTFVGQHPGIAHDRRNIGIVQKYSALHKQREHMFTRAKDLADVAVVFSCKSQDRFGSDETQDDNYVAAVRGWEQVLWENHVPFTLIPDSCLKAGELDKYKCVVLANTACIGDEQASAIRDYVNRGGSLVASYETSLYDENYQKRCDFALADVFGVSYRLTRGPLPVSYHWLRKEHPIAQTFGDTDMIANNGYVCYVHSGECGKVAATLIPEIIPQHPENAWVPEMEIDVPTIITHEFGEGRVVYLANQVDKLYLADANPDYGKVLLESLNWAMSGKQLSVKVKAPASVMVEFLEQKAETGDTRRLLATLINLTGSPKRPLTDPLPIGGIELVLSDPRLSHLKNAYRLSDGARLLSGECTNDGISIRLDELKEFDTVVFESTEL